MTVESQQLAPIPAAGAATTAGGRRLPRGRTATSLTPISGLGLGIALTWFSLLVLIPLTAVLVQASAGVPPHDVFMRPTGTPSRLCSSRPK